MSYFLCYKYDYVEPQKLRKLPFPTIDEALAEACAVFAQKKGWDFEITDEQGITVMAESDIRDAYEEA